MKEEIKEQLDTEISSKLDSLSEMDVNSDTYKIAVESISKLIDRRNEIDKLNLEVKKHELNEWTETNRMSREKSLNEYNEKDQLIKNAISIGSILIPVFVTVWGTYKTLKFEETGTVTTSAGRNFISRLFPKK